MKGLRTILYFFLFLASLSDNLFIDVFVSHCCVILFQIVFIRLRERRYISVIFSSIDVLLFLQEKERLLGELRSHAEGAESERYRQRELARLRWEQRALCQEQRFGTASLVLSLGWQQQHK